MPVMVVVGVVVAMANGITVEPATVMAPVVAYAAIPRPIGPWGPAGPAGPCGPGTCMIDLMSDYAKAVNTMQTLNKQMMVARATAPMDAIKSAPSEGFGLISSKDFMAQSEKMMEKLHELSMDLTRASGAEIPDVIWKKYHSGETNVFSRWLVKMLGATNKKDLREMMKADAVFRSQAMQFVRSFDKILNAAKQADDSDNLSATLIKTDLGHIYITLKNNL